LLSLLGTRISRREKPVAAWFGAVCVAFPVVAHSSTDVPIARVFDVEDLAGIPDGPGGDGTGSKVPQPLGGTGGT
jgi:hypothetical protein